MDNVCPDNSTACLLREIYQANSGYNWDPVTFGFTAIFTIIALVVSVVALFQSFIAASPSRLKASERAIGKKQHDHRANTRFNWQEFRFRTVVNVPVIDTQKILDHKPAVITIRDKIAHEESPPLTRENVVASWSQLLFDLSLTDIDFDYIECLTDYLPDDIPAAPAWARVQAIVCLCIMKGCTRLIENDGGYIDATGMSAQLSWNMHPTLGPIAMYRSWDVKESTKHVLQDVQCMIPVFLGELYLSGQTLFKPLPTRRRNTPLYFDFMKLKSVCGESWGQCDHQHDHCINRKRHLWIGYLVNKNWEGGVNKQTASLASALFADRPGKVKAFPTRASTLHSALKTMHEEYFPWLIVAEDLDDRVLSTLVGSSFVEFDSREAIPDMSLLEDKQNSWLPGASNTASKVANSSVLERPALNPMESRKGMNIGWTPNQPITDEKLLSNELRISRTAVSCASKWLADDTYFETSNKKEMDEARRWLSYQLAELDWFLSRVGKEAICAATNLVALGTEKFGVLPFTTLPRRFIMPETLDAFNLDWRANPEDTSSIIISGYLDQETIQRLYARSRDYINQNRKNLHTVKCPQAAQGFYYVSNEPHPKSAPIENNNNPFASSDEMSDLSKAASTGSVNKRIANVEARHPSVGTPEYTEEVPRSSSSATDTAPVMESDPASRPKVDDPTLRELFTGDQRGSPEDEVPVHVDERVAALEALMFFRAAIFGALLATGADTSVLLASDKRFQLVQVQ